MFRLWAFGVLGLGFGAWDFGFWVLGLGFCGLGLWGLDLGFGLRTKPELYAEYTLLSCFWKVGFISLILEESRGSGFESLMGPLLPPWEFIAWHSLLRT